MPIYPKCGKSFSSEQALTYHLNKKYKCGTWKCAACNSAYLREAHQRRVQVWETQLYIPHTKVLLLSIVKAKLDGATNKSWNYG